MGGVVVAVRGLLSPSCGGLGLCVTVGLGYGGSWRVKNTGAGGLWRFFWGVP